MVRRRADGPGASGDRTPRETCHDSLRTGARPRAFVVRRPGQTLDAEALVAWCRDSMAPYKVPREVRFLDALPATGAGKVLRRLLRDMA